MKHLKTSLAALCLSLLCLSLWAAPVTYPGPTAADDTGATVSPTSVSVASVTDLDGNAITSPGAVGHVAGPNTSVVYDAAAHGEAWITLTPVLSGHTFANSPPRIFCSADPQTLASTYTSSTGNGTVLTSTGVKIASSQNFNNTNTSVPGYWSSTTPPGYYVAPANPTDYARNNVSPSWYTSPLVGGTAPAWYTSSLPGNFALLSINGSGLVTTSNPASTSSGPTPADFWSYSSRSLTDKAGYGATVNGYAAGQDPATQLKADPAFAKLLNHILEKYTYAPGTHVVTVKGDDNSTLGTVTITVDSSGNIVSRT